MLSTQYSDQSFKKDLGVEGTTTVRDLVILGRIINESGNEIPLPDRQQQNFAFRRHRAESTSSLVSGSSHHHHSSRVYVKTIKASSDESSVLLSINIRHPTSTTFKLDFFCYSESLQCLKGTFLVRSSSIEIPTVKCLGSIEATERFHTPLGNYSLSPGNISLLIMPDLKEDLEIVCEISFREMRDPRLVRPSLSAPGSPVRVSESPMQVPGSPVVTVESPSLGVVSPRSTVVYPSMSAVESTPSECDDWENISVDSDNPPVARMIFPGFL